MAGFLEFISEPESEEFTGSAVEVQATNDGYFVIVQTDSYEGCAQMTLPVAKRLRQALDRAIEFADSRRPTAGTKSPESSEASTPPASHPPSNS